MAELKIKHRRGELILTEKDEIMYNGACYQLMTQKYWEGYCSFWYELSKTTCDKLIKEGKIINSHNSRGLIYYKVAK